MTEAISCLSQAFLRDPADLYLLRLAAGSISGVLTNIDEDGAPAMAYHGDPKLMAFDPARPADKSAIQKGTRVLISLWDSLMFGRVPGTRPNISESHSDKSTRVSALLVQP